MRTPVKVKVQCNIEAHFLQSFFVQQLFFASISVRDTKKLIIKLPESALPYLSISMILLDNSVSWSVISRHSAY
jgi:hypothetical protein